MTLHDLEVVDVNAPEKGWFGFRSQTGLMGLLGRDLSKKLLTHFQENVPAYAKQAEEAYRIRKQELDIEFFYKKKNITTPETLLTDKVVLTQLCQNPTVSDQVAPEESKSSEIPYCKQRVDALAQQFFHGFNEHYKTNTRNAATDLRAARQIIFEPTISGTTCPHCPFPNLPTDGSGPYNYTTRTRKGQNKTSICAAKRTRKDL